MRPETTIFLGDLLDGGREWPVPKETEQQETSLPLPPLLKTNPLNRLHYIDGGYWGRQYKRFTRLYVDSWQEIRAPDFMNEKHAIHNRLIYGLPGNHDIGFGYQIHKDVAQRFEKSFGPRNRVDIIGNHTFVSVDSPSLSAIEQADKKAPKANELKEIWGEAMEFLHKLPEKRRAMLAGKLRSYDDELSVADFPVVLLSHVPLWRKEGTPCGPLREKQSNAKKASIPISFGYQYQNVLTYSISELMIHHIGTPVSQIFSGDDHDYCEITHDEFPGNPREITVKSASMAMGLRKPAFMLVSLWNPVDQRIGTANDSVQKKEQTIQNKLCLLPDQVGIYIWYGKMAIVTFVLLLGRALLRAAFSDTRYSQINSYSTTSGSNFDGGDSSRFGAQTAKASSHNSSSYTMKSRLDRELNLAEKLEDGYADKETITTKLEPPEVARPNGKFRPSIPRVAWLVPSSHLLSFSRTDLRIAYREAAAALAKIAAFGTAWYLFLFLT